MSESLVLSQNSVQTRHWRVALVLGVAGTICVLLLLPYLFALTPQLKAKIPVPLALFALLQSVQGGVVFTLLAWAGLALGWRYQLDAPWLRTLLHAGTPQQRPARWQMAAVMGIAAGAACVLLGGGFAWLAPTANKPLAGSPNWWQGLLASFYGGIAEEMLCRLFLVSLLVWIGAKFSRNAAPGSGLYWIAIVVAALLFGIAHLPTAAQLGLVTPLHIMRVVSLNTIVGITCGWLFWRYGIEHAMLAHFSADLVLHVVAPLL